MKEFDIVKIKDVKKCHKESNLDLAAFEGVVQKIDGDEVCVVFFNKSNRGDYAVWQFKQKELEVVLETNYEWKSVFEKVDAVIDYSKKRLSPLLFKEVDAVELINNKPRYEKKGLKSGAKGVIAIDYAVNGEILVDFGSEGSLEPCELVSVRLEDLKKI